MAVAADFFEEDSPHGLGKRLIYKKYLQAYIPIILSDQSPYNYVTIFDAFAGTGRYEVNGWPAEIEKYGTPIIALHVAIDYFWGLQYAPSPPLEPNESDEADLQLLEHLQKVEGTIKCGFADLNYHILWLVLVEPSITNYKKLFKNILHIMRTYGLHTKIIPNFPLGSCTIACGKHTGKYPIRCFIYCAEFAQVAAPSPPSFALIDPFGFGQIPLNKVKEFVGQGREVFINLMSSYINRFLSVKLDTVSNLFGLHIKKPTDLLGNDPSDKIAMIVDTYEEQLKEEAGADYVLNFEMRGNNNARLYHLVFATNHVKGLEMMKEAMNRGTQEANEGKFALSDYMIVRKGKTLSFTNDQDDAIVADIIFNKFKGKHVSVTTVRGFIFCETLFVYRKKALSILEKRGLMTVTNEDGNRRRNTYPDRKEWLLQFAE